MIKFTTIGTLTVDVDVDTVNVRPTERHFEITNLTGRVIARTTDTSDLNRAGAVALAKRRMGDVYEIWAKTRIRHIAHF